MYCHNLVLSRHAIQQMFYRRISKKEVETVIIYGEVIEETPNEYTLSQLFNIGFYRR